MKKLLLFSIALFYAVTALAQVPTINSFIPTSGPIGTLITINGNNLGNTLTFTISGVNLIKIAGTSAEVIGMVMPGTTTGKAVITTSGGSVTSAINFTITPTFYPVSQQGTKLVGGSAIGAAAQGYSVAVSSDGYTAIIGGKNDNSQIGAAWVYTRSGNIWTQQGSKLVGTGGVGIGSQGCSVAISADGSTVIVGGSSDNGLQGAAWIFTRSGNEWTQQGSKLVGTGVAGTAAQGSAVSISADGNTAIIGGPHDDNAKGAVWVFKRSAGKWQQEGSKLVGTGIVSSAGQGSALSISADGNTFLVGGLLDDDLKGAAWIFKRAGSAWAQQGDKLLGSDAIGTATQGSSVSISADGNTAIVGGWGDNNYTGACWVYVLSNGEWKQQGVKLVNASAVEGIMQGVSVAISADGNTALAGTAYLGATIYTRSSEKWMQRGETLFGSGTKGDAAQGNSVSLSADGRIALIGGLNDNSSVGAAWAFSASATSIPTITLISPATAVAGTTITITGSNFAGVTAVNFGGIPATSFTVVSANTITAIVGAGSSGDVSITTPVNTVNFSGFNFVPVPTVTAAGPTNIISGGSVILNTTPASGYSYQWLRDGINITGATSSSYKATLAGVYTVSISLNSVIQVSSSGVSVNTVFELQANNFQFVITSATCKGSANGSISITATQNLAYTATITGNGVNTPYAFTNSTQINNLAAGTYDVCITVAGQADFQQCFTTVIKEPKDLSVYTAVSPSGDQVVVNMDGAAEYKIMLNGILYLTEDSQITLPLAKGVNAITVSTDSPCQGVIVKNINVSPEILVYPNPFTNNINLSLGIDNLKSALISVINVGNGQPVYTNIYNNVTGTLQIDLSGISSGLYLLRISGDNLEKVFKILKK